MAARTQPKQGNSDVHAGVPPPSGQQEEVGPWSPPAWASTPSPGPPPNTAARHDSSLPPCAATFTAAKDKGIMWVGSGTGGPGDRGQGAHGLECAGGGLGLAPTKCNRLPGFLRPSGDANFHLTPPSPPHHLPPSLPHPLPHPYLHPRISCLPSRRKGTAGATRPGQKPRRRRWWRTHGATNCQSPPKTQWSSRVCSPPTPWPWGWVAARVRAPHTFASQCAPHTGPCTAAAPWRCGRQRRAGQVGNPVSQEQVRQDTTHAWRPRLRLVGAPPPPPA
jgi:hypothetical protein